MKPQKGWPPRWLTPVSPAEARRGDGEHAAAWIEAFCRVTQDSVAAIAESPLELRLWQRQILAHVLARRADGKYRHRQGLIGLARKNGKSSLGAALALYGLLSDYPG